MRRRLVPAFLLAGLLAAAAPGAAAAAELHAPSDATAPSRPFAQPLRDVLVTSPAQARASAAGGPTASTSAQRVRSSDGSSAFDVELSPSYGALTQERVRPFVDFIASRLHGPELARLNLFIVTPAEVKQLCSSEALACYIPSREIMIIPGEQTPSNEVPVEYVITHEYGHHVATNRDNDPWPAVAWGPKAWATQEGVCAGVATRRYFPGDQGEDYVRNPGENFAEVYAQLHYRNRIPWQFDASLAPDEPAFAAVVRDVTRPWTRSVAVRRSGSLTSRRRAKTFSVTTTLDGRFKLSLLGPRRANFDLQLISDGRRVLRTSRRGSRDSVSRVVCQVRTFQVRVVRRSGSGRFTLRVQTPG